MIDTEDARTKNVRAFLVHIIEFLYLPDILYSVKERDKFWFVRMKVC